MGTGKDSQLGKIKNGFERECRGKRSGHQTSTARPQTCPHKRGGVSRLTGGHFFVTITIRRPKPGRYCLTLDCTHDLQSQRPLAGPEDCYRKPPGTFGCGRRSDQHSHAGVSVCPGMAPAVLGEREAARAGPALYGRDRCGNQLCTEGLSPQGSPVSFLPKPRRSPAIFSDCPETSQHALSAATKR